MAEPDDIASKMVGNVPAPSRDLENIYRPRSEVAKGAAAFVDETQALGGGLLSLVGTGFKNIGFEGAGGDLARIGSDIYTEQMRQSRAGWQAPEVEKVEDIDLTEPGGIGRLGDWAAYQGTKGLATLGSLALSGGVGGAVGRQAAGKAVRQIARQSAQRAGGRAAAPELGAAIKSAAQAEVRRATTRGAQVGAGGAGFLMETGQAMGQNVEAGATPDEAALPALAVGAVNAALEAIPVMGAFRAMGLGDDAMGAIRRYIKSDNVLADRLRQTATAMVQGAATEGATEALQEIVGIAGQRVATDEELLAGLSDEERSQILNAAAAGGLVGGGMGTFAGGVRAGATQGPEFEAPLTAEQTEPLNAESRTPVPEGPDLKRDAGVPSPIAPSQETLEVNAETVAPPAAETTAETVPTEEGAGRIVVPGQLPFESTDRQAALNGEARLIGNPNRELGESIGFADRAEAESFAAERNAAVTELDDGTFGIMAYSEPQPGEWVEHSDIRQEIDAAFGSGFAERMEKEGILKLRRAGPSPGVRGLFTQGDFAVSIFANNLPDAKAAVDTLLHEGVHSSLRDMMGRRYPQLVKDVQAMAAQGNRAARRGVRRGLRDRARWAARWAEPSEVEGVNFSDPAQARAFLDRIEPRVFETMPNLRNILDHIEQEETLAHYVTEVARAGETSGVMRRVLNEVKAMWMSSDLGQALGAPKLSDETAVPLAKMAVRESYRMRQEAMRLAAQVQATPPAARDNTPPPLAMDVYHGTDRPWTQLQPELQPGGLSVAARGYGFYTTDSPATAGDYTVGSDEGVVYKLDVPDADVERMMQWDVPLRQQSDHVRDTLTMLGLPVDWRQTGGEYYQQLAAQMGAQNASGLLAAAGIPGNIHGDGSGATNYTIWDAEAMARISNKGAMRKVLSDGAGKPFESLAEAVELENRVRDRIYTDPETDVLGDVNPPGLLNKFIIKAVDALHDLERKSKRLYAVANVAISKRNALIEETRRREVQPIVDLMSRIIERYRRTDPNFSMADLNEAVLAAHIVRDRVNERMAEGASKQTAIRLEKALAEAKGNKEAVALRRRLATGRRNLLAGKMVDGKSLTEANGTPRELTPDEKRREMRKLVDDVFSDMIEADLMGETSRNIWRNWEGLKHHGGGMATPGVAHRNIAQESPAKDANEINDRFANDAEIQELIDYLSGYTERTAEVLEAGGLIANDDLARMRGASEHYVPLFREAYNRDQEIQRLLGRTSGSAKPMNRAGAGEFMEVVSPIANALAQRDAAISAATSNHVREALAADIQRDEARWKGWFTVVEEDKNFRKSRDEDGFIQDVVSSGDEVDIPFYKGGRRFIIKVEKDNPRAIHLARTLQGLDVRAANNLVRGLQGINSWIRNVVVTYNPAFVAVNLPRDVSTAYLNLKGTELKDHAGKVVKEWRNSFRALKKVLIDGSDDMNDPDVALVNEWRRAGGQISFVQSLKVNDDTLSGIEAQTELFASKAPQDVAMRGAKALLDRFENYNALIENVMRLSTYKVARETGMGKTRAAMMSKDVTTNFDRRGEWARVAGALYLFYNASIQGNAQVIRNLLGDNGKSMAKAAGAVMGMAFLIDQLGAAISDDDDEDGRLNWDDTPDWKKEKFARFPIGVDGTYATIPLPWVFNVFWRAGEMASEAMRGVKPVTDIPGELTNLTLNTFNPIAGGTLGQTLAPTALDPVLQIIEQHDAFGNPLSPMRFPGDTTPDAYRAWRTTPDGYRWLSETLNELTGGNRAESGMIDIAPSTIEVLVNTLTGGLGSFAAQAAGTAEGAATGELEFLEAPIVRSYLFAPKDRQDSTDYFERIARVKAAAKAERLYTEGPYRDPVALSQLRRDRRAELRLYQYTLDTETRARDLRKQMRSAEAHGDDDKVERIADQIERLYERYNRRYEASVL